MAASGVNIALMAKRKTADKVTKAWTELEKTIKKHAPKTLATLLPGASEAQIGEAEKALGFKLPADVKAFFMTHSGEEPAEVVADGALDYGYLLPLVGENDSCVAEHSKWREMLNGVEDDSVKGLTFNAEKAKLWLPFSKDYGGITLMVDCNPDGAGMVIKYDTEGKYLLKTLATDFADYLEKEAEKLEQGTRGEDDGWGDDEDEDEDGDADDLGDDDEGGEPKGRKGEWMEVSLKLPNIKSRKFGALIQTATMKEMDIVAEILDPKAFREDFDPKCSVALSIYCHSNPSQMILSDFGGEGEVENVYFFKDEDLLPVMNKSVSQASFKKEVKGALPVFCWSLDEPIGKDLGLILDIRRPKSSK